MMRRIAGPVAVLLLSACAVGPNFHTPAPPAVAAYTPDPLPQTVSPAQTPAATSAFSVGSSADTAATQSFVWGGTVSVRWWEAFGSPALNALEDEALRRNPDVASATAALRAARQNYLAQRGALFPTVDANAQGQRQRISGVLSPVLNDNSTVFNLYTLGATASYTLDLFGGARRGIEGARAQAEAQRFQTEAAYLTVTSNVANTAITLASTERQMAIVRQVVDADHHFLAIVAQQQQLGGASGAETAAAQLALSQAEALLPALSKQQAQAHDLLAILAGRYPADHFDAPDLAALHLPAQLPVSLPADLVAQRPDIRSAQANLHNASAQVGVAIAARLPNFTVNAAGGGTSNTLSTIFAGGNTFWSIAGNILQPIFDGGTLLHKQRAAEATLDQAKAQYRSTVLSGLQNVADTLQAITADANELGSATAADAAANRALGIARDQARLGQISGAATLTLETAWLQAEQNLVQARAQRLTDSVALYMALGGGWWNRRGEG